MAVSKEISEFVDEVWPSVKKDIAALVAVDSVEDLAAAAPGAPWGPGPRAAMDEALDQARRHGLETCDIDGRIAYADLPGTGDGVLATIAHVDVVPAGPGWDSNPFELRERDGYLVGRGVVDDKGPFVLTLWAAEYFRRVGRPLPRTLRCIVGANEETGMKDVAAYLEREGEPWFLFTPDAEFCVGCGEKGHLTATFFSGPVAGAPLVSVSGGTVANAVPGTATAVVGASAASLPVADGIEVRDLGNGLAEVTATGVGGHASLPDGTVNAIGVLIGYIADNGLYDERTQGGYVSFMEGLLASTDGSSVGLDSADDKFGPLTMVGGVARTVDGRFTQTVDIRFPTSTTSEHLHAVLFRFAEEHGMRMSGPHVMEPSFIEPDSPQVRALLDAYEGVTGREGDAFTMGGGTYARHFANAVSFGPEGDDPDKPEWAGSMHGPNEAVSEESLREALAVYVQAIENLMAL